MPPSKTKPPAGLPAAGPPDLPPLAEQWLERLTVERGYSPRTIASYRQALALLAELAGPTEFAAITAQQVRGWIARLSRQGQAPRTTAQRLSVWRGFFDYCARETGQPAAAAESLANPARGIKAPRAPRRLPKALSPDLAGQLVDYQPGASFEMQRDKAMLELLYSSGLRLAELCSLDAAYQQDRVSGYQSESWLDVAEAQVTVLGKGSKSRTVPVGRAALDALALWLEMRGQWLQDHPRADQAALFLSNRGRRLSHRSVQVRLKRLALKQGIPANVHPHVLRHSFASHVLQSSGDLRAVQELLGHASISTTQVYTSLDFQRLAQVYDAAHPRARRDTSE